MTDSSVRGRFVWYEVMTTDPKGAQAFYGKLAGWSAAPWGSDWVYSLWMNGEAPVGGCMELPAELRAAGVPAHWLAYVGVPEIQEGCAEVARLGGKVMKEPEEIPGAGRFAVASDPHGAVFGIYTPEGATPGPEGGPKLGEFSWHELATTDPAAAVEFYGKLFGWKEIERNDMGPMGIYHVFGREGTMLGGMYRKPPQVPVANWLPYIMVSSADEAADRARVAGGTIVHGPMEVPGGDRIAMGIDPQGAAFAVHSAKA